MRQLALVTCATLGHCRTSFMGQIRSYTQGLVLKNTAAVLRVRGLVNLKGFPKLAFRTGSELGSPAPTFQIVPTTLRTHPMMRLIRTSVVYILFVLCLLRKSLKFILNHLQFIYKLTMH